jgi:hypothetical protein
MLFVGTVFQIWPAYRNKSMATSPVINKNSLDMLLCRMVWEEVCESRGLRSLCAGDIKIGIEEALPTARTPFVFAVHGSYVSNTYVCGALSLVTRSKRLLQSWL